MKPTEDFIPKILAAYKTDFMAQKWGLQSRTQPFDYNGKTYVPQEILPQVVRGYHDNPKYGHPGTARMVELLSRNWSSPRMKTEIEKYIRECPQCCKNKARNHAKYGYLQKIKLPQIPWQSVTMDFITKLPASKEPSTREI